MQIFGHQKNTLKYGWDRGSSKKDYVVFERSLSYVLIFPPKQTKQDSYRPDIDLYGRFLEQSIKVLN